MRVLFLLPAEYVVDFIDDLAGRLMECGAVVEILCASKIGVNVKSKLPYKVWNWSDFFFAPIESFSPTHIIVWNGYAEETVSAAYFLKRKYRVSILEMGWLPQEVNAYCLPDAAAKCPITPKETCTPSESDMELLTTTRDLYKPAPKSEWMPEKFILVPLQLEHDTVIKNFSPIFKKMSKLMAYVINSSSIPVVVKRHPKDPNQEVPPGCVIAPEGVLIKDVAPYAETVIGINSTALIESLVYNDRVVCFGDNIGMNAMFKGHIDYIEKIDSIPPDKFPSRRQIDCILVEILKTQFSYEHVPDWVIERIRRA